MVLDVVAFFRLVRKKKGKKEEKRDKFIFLDFILVLEKLKIINDLWLLKYGVIIKREGIRKKKERGLKVIVFFF